MKDRDISCQDLVELVTDYLEGALPRAERRRFEAHLRICEGCANYVEQIRATVLLAGRTRPDEVAELPGFDRLLEAFRDYRRGATA